MRRFAGVAAAVAAVIGAAVVEAVRTGSAVEAGEAAVAALIAVGVAWLASTLPGATVRSTAIGGTLVLAGILTWTSTDRPIVIWAVLGLGGILYALVSRPWTDGLRQLPRLGGAWTGLAYWPLGVLGALLVGHWTVGAQRAAYAGVFALAVLAVITHVRRTGRDPGVGVTAAILFGLAALLLAGSGSLFDVVHEAPAGSAQAMRDRFWGGLGLFYHPNSLAGLAVIAAIRVGADRAFRTGQRLAVTALAGLLLSLSDSRTGLVFAAAAAVVHAVLVVRRLRPDLPDHRRPWLAAATPFLVLTIVYLSSGGVGYLTRDRLNTGANPGSSQVAAATSGRTDTWKQVWNDWEDAPVAEKLFGDATTSRAVVTRLDDGAPPEGPRRQLNTDNAAVGAFRRGGVAGAVAFLFGVGLLGVHALRRRRDGTSPAAWFSIGVVAVVPTIATEDWLLGGTNGALWLVLVAGEAYRVFRPSVECRVEDEKWRAEAVPRTLG